MSVWIHVDGPFCAVPVGRQLHVVVQVLEGGQVLPVCEEDQRHLLVLS